MNNTNIYIGTVINNKDPKDLGRVQVYIPSLDPLLNKTLNEGNSQYVFPGDDNNGALSSIDIEQLTQSCTWCSVLQPIFGGSAQGYYDDGKSSVSINGNKDSKPLNSDQREEAYTYKDAFANPKNRLVRKSNFYGNEYNPKKYTNAPNGIYSSIDIGAKVSVIFLDNNKNQALIIGKVPTANEINILK